METIARRLGAISRPREFGRINRADPGMQRVPARRFHATRPA